METYLPHEKIFRKKKKIKEKSSQVLHMLLQLEDTMGSLFPSMSRPSFDNRETQGMRVRLHVVPISTASSP